MLGCIHADSSFVRHPIAVLFRDLCAVAQVEWNGFRGRARKTHTCDLIAQRLTHVLVVQDRHDAVGFIVGAGVHRFRSSGSGSIRSIQIDGYRPILLLRVRDGDPVNDIVQGHGQLIGIVKRRVAVDEPLFGLQILRQVEVEFTDLVHLLDQRQGRV